MKVTNLFTDKDREVFDRIDRDCLAMHVPTPPKMFLKLEVRDGAGELTDVYEDRAHSWVRNFYNMFYNTLTVNSGIGSAYGAGSSICKTLSGSTLKQTLSVSSGALGNDSSGIIIGGGNTPESFESFQLSQHILNGTTAGKMSYQAGVRTSGPYDAALKKYTLSQTRVFNNNSGADIVVSEVGFASDASGGLLLARDVLAEAKTVPNAGQLTVTYTIEMTFPA